MARVKLGCGTRAGYADHRRKGEKPCSACNKANNVYRREQRARAKQTEGKATESAPKKAPKKVKKTVLPVETTPKRAKKDPGPVEAVPAVAPTPSVDPVTALSDALGVDLDPWQREAIQNALTATKPPEPTPEPVTAPTPVPEPEPPVEATEDVPPPPDWLKAKGKALWASVVDRYVLTDAALAMLTEACRTIDRLERFSAALASQSTFWFEVKDIDMADENGVPVVVNGMIGEARQLQTVLRQTLTALGVVGVEDRGDGVVEKDPLDELVALRQARLAKMNGA